MSASRKEAVSFSSELDYGTIGIFIKNPDNVYNFTAYLAPFTYWSWVSITLFLLLFSIVIFAMARLVKEPFKISILESFETVTFAFLLTDSPFKPSCLTMQILLVRYDYLYKKNDDNFLKNVFYFQYSYYSSTYILPLGSHAHYTLDH